MKHKVKIKDILIENNNFIIESTNNIKFESEIKNGSVSFKIYNNDKKELYLHELEIGDIVKIYCKKNINNIIIDKIIAFEKYKFFSDSEISI